MKIVNVFRFKKDKVIIIEDFYDVAFILFFENEGLVYRIFIVG